LADDNGTDSTRTKQAGRATPAMSLSETEWKTFITGVNRIATAVKRETGLRTVFHHHCAGFVEQHHEIEQLLALTDPDIVGLVFDTGHYAFGANNCLGVVEAMEQFAGRIWYVHFKDCHGDIATRSRAENWDYFTTLQHGVFCELGQGCVDFKGVVQWLHDHNYNGWITVEQDILPGMGVPKESAARNRDYLRTIGL